MKIRNFYDKTPVILSFLFCTVQTIAGLVLPACIGTIVNRGIMMTDVPAIRRTGALMLAAALTMGICGYLSYICGNIASLGFAHRMRTELFRRITGLSTERINSFGSGSIITRLTVDTERLSAVVNLFIELFYKPVLMTAGGLIMLFRVNSDFGFIFALFVLIQLALTIGFILKISPIFDKVQKIIDSINEKLQETLRNLRLIKVQRSEDRERGAFNEISGELYGNNVRIFSIISFFNPIMMFILNITIVVIILILGVKAGGNGVVGNIMMVITYSEQILMSIMAASNIAKSMSELIPSYRRASEIYSASEEGGGSRRIDAPVEVFSAENASYGCGEEKNILDDITFTVKSGELLPVYGGTGEGKTVLALLLGGFIAPTGGRITLGGESAGDFIKSDIKRHIAVVSNIGNSLFDGSLRENISLGREGITDADIDSAVDSAMLGDYLSALPYGLDSRMDSGGNALSGGQKQRLMIARALAAKPDILVIDDATSSLDFATEEALFDKIKSNYPKTAVVFITQRLTSARRYGRYLRLAGGRLEECSR